MINDVIGVLVLRYVGPQRFQSLERRIDVRGLENDVKPSLHRARSVGCTFSQPTAPNEVYAAPRHGQLAHQGAKKVTLTGFGMVKLWAVAESLPVVRSTFISTTELDASLVTSSQRPVRSRPTLQGVFPPAEMR